MAGGVQVNVAESLQISLTSRFSGAEGGSGDKKIPAVILNVSGRVIYMGAVELATATTAV